MRTLAVLSQKGGTGKTTVAVHLAQAAWASNKRVLLADLDPQRSAADWRRARAGGGPGLIETKAGALFVAQQAAQRAGIELMVLDTRPAADSETADAIRAADLCLIVLRPSFFDLQATARVAEMTRDMGKAALVLLNQAPPRRGDRETSAVMETLDALRALGLTLAPVGLRSRTVYQTAVARGLTAQEVSGSAAAAKEIDMLWQHVEQTLFASRPVPRRATGAAREPAAQAAPAKSPAAHAK